MWWTFDPRNNAQRKRRIRIAPGRRVRKRTEGFKTRREAESERDRLRNEVRSGVDAVPQRLTVGALLDRWLAGKPPLSATTRERYAGLIARVKPHLGTTLVAKIRPMHVADLYALLLSRCRVCTLATSGPVRQNRCASGLSPTSVNHVHALLKAVFAWAVRMQVLGRNPIASIDEDAPSRAEPKVDAYTDAEITALLDAARETRWARWDSAIMLALATGARRGELAALRWADVRLEKTTVGVERGMMTIRGSFSETRAGVVLKSTKTGRERIVPLSSLAIEVLAQQRFRQAEDAFKAAEGYASEGFVFADVFGRPLRPNDFTNAFRKIAKRAGVKKRLHDARHWTGSHLLAAGVDVRTTATLLGHSTPQTTLNVYAHQLAGLTGPAMDELDVRLRAAIAHVK